jgi:photosystem II stability/assembly factor-like uncharacterized protein
LLLSYNYGIGLFELVPAPFALPAEKPGHGLLRGFPELGARPDRIIIFELLIEIIKLSNYLGFKFTLPMNRMNRMTFATLIKTAPLFLVASGLAAQSVFDDWRIRQPNPPANALRTAIYAEGRFVAAGYHATVVTSATGSVWETRFLEPEFDAQGLVYAEGQYVMVDRGGYVATSPNLDAWFLERIGASTLDDVIHAEGTFITVGRLSRIFSSDDAQTWTRSDVPVDNQHLKGVAHGNGFYCVVARGGKVFRSPDLENWTEVFAGFEGTENQTNNWEGMAFFNGKFVAYGPLERLLISSDNGTSWTEVPLEFESGMVDHVEWNGRLYLSGGSDAIINSSDGITWERFSPGRDLSLGAIAASPDRILALDDSSGVLASDDGETWTRILENENPDFRSVAYRDGIYVALANGDLLFRSVDGVNWTLAEDASGINANFAGVAALDVGFVAVGGRGEVATSPDGLSWNTGTFLDFTYIIREVSVANGILFAGSDSGTIYHTSDGVNWTETDTGAGSGNQNRIEQVSYFNETYFAAGGNGTLASSPDLVNWTLTPLGTEAVMEKLLYFNNRYIMIPVSGSRVLFSDDLVTWTDDRLVPIIRAGGAWIYDGRIVIAGNVGSMYTSEDGATFTEHLIPASTFREIVFDGEQYVAVGPAGVIATTGTNPLSLLNLTVIGNGQVDRFPDLPLYDASTLVRLTAEAPEGQQFLWWETTEGPVYDPSIELSLDADTNLTAVFAGLTPPPLTVQVDANGLFFDWINDPAWLLHESSNLVDWAPVAGVEVEDDASRLENQAFDGQNRLFRFQLRNP